MVIVPTLYHVIPFPLPSFPFVRLFVRSFIYLVPFLGFSTFLSFFLEPLLHLTKIKNKNK